MYTLLHSFNPFWTEFELILINPLQTECYQQSEAGECHCSTEGRSNGDGSRSTGGRVYLLYSIFTIIHTRVLAYNS